MGPPIVLELQNIRKSFGRTVAVADLNLSVTRGDLVALLGPSGCGKTTTLWIVAGFERPDEGDVLISQQSVTDLPANRRDVGMVFQNYALFPHMTVFENIAYGLRRRRVAKAEISERVAQVLDLVRLIGLETRYPRQLSGGQQQRVAVARAVVIRPSVLLLDEPLSNLDAKLRQEMRGELRRLQQRLEITTIFVTHDQDEALSMADRIVVMNSGRVEQSGSPQEIYDRPGTRFVANFIGDCNFLSGRVERMQDGMVHLAVGKLLIMAAVDSEASAVASEGTLALRPEDIMVLGENAEVSPDTNVMEGRVCGITYLGATRRYRVAVDEGVEVLVTEQRRRSPLHEGDLIRLAWEPSAGMFHATDAER